MNAVNAVIDSSEQRHFKEHIIAALSIYDFFSGGLLGGDATRLISLFASPVGGAFTLMSVTGLMTPSHPSSIPAPRCLRCFLP
jgi:hypothetical protein